MKVEYFILVFLTQNILAWDAEDLSLFDVVEDVNRNFYELLEIKQEASNTEIRRAYRRLSLQLHPDKNPHPDREAQFRKLVAVYEVLKDENLRNKYHEVLEHGLPDWRQPVFYYRKVKKMGLVDLSLFLSVILTFGHYVVLWTAYLERKFELEQVFKPKKKKDKKGKKIKLNDEDEEVVLPEELAHLCVKPTYKDVLPIVIFRHFINFFTQLPSTISNLLCSMRKSKDEDEGDEDDDEDTDIQRVVRKAGPTEFEMAQDINPINYTRQNQQIGQDVCEDEAVENKKKSEKWSDGEMVMLVRAVVKFPGGSLDRWNKIASMVGRSPTEVMNMVKKFKSTQVMSEMNDKVVVRKGVTSMNLQPSQTTEADGCTISEADYCVLPSEVKNHNANLISSFSPSSSSSSPPSSSSSSPSLWSQEEQRSLETAMLQVDKKAENRWDLISTLVQGKTKVECLQRVKYLSNLVKKKKLESTTTPEIMTTANKQKNETKAKNAIS